MAASARLMSRCMLSKARRSLGVALVDTVAPLGCCQCRCLVRLVSTNPNCAIVVAMGSRRAIGDDGVMM